MSTYENYHQTSQVYDKTRSAGGVKIIRNVLAERHSPRHWTTVIKRTLIIITHLKEALLHIDANRLIVAP